MHRTLRLLGRWVQLTFLQQEGRRTPSLNYHIVMKVPPELFCTVLLVCLISDLMNSIEKIDSSSESRLVICYLDLAVRRRKPSI